MTGTLNTGASRSSRASSSNGPLKGFSTPAPPENLVGSGNGQSQSAPSMPVLGSPAPPQAQQAPQAPPAPSHAQTVAALRHFSAIMGELNTLIKDPDLGKADMKSAIIDGTTKLVSERMISPAQAVQMLATVPERPFDQKTWIMGHMQQAMQGENAVLVHHAAAFAGAPAQPTPDADDHMDDLSSMMQTHYAGH